MSIFKCKMCGGDLEIAEGVTIAECEYCGTRQPVPKSMDENLQNLFNRANTLRIKSEFDKAEKLYEKIIQVDTTQSESYWGLILCKYGIEYVDDPATLKKIPTCHRASYDSIIADDDYKSALENADANQRALYEEQAKEIDRIQKEILALAQKEETYDIFICYKESDADGKRTQDSVIANDIYYQLTQEGFKVFYAAITLEGKLGSAYESIIFAALNSAKVMLTIGTKPEHFNAVWVKNEWSRFLKIIKNDRSKLLIPCYKDMDAYELPEEFAHLQAQDMGKIGFINDVVRGIKKVISKDEPKATFVKETVVSTANASVAPLLKRAFMFLEDGDFDSADEYCEKVLDADPENAMAYVGKLMVELRVKKQEDLKNCTEPFDGRNNYQKAMRFADDKLKAELNSYIEYVIAHKDDVQFEEFYNNARTEMLKAESEFDFKEVADLFDFLGEYKDSKHFAEECRTKADAIRKNEILERAKIAMERDDEKGYNLALEILNTVPKWENANDLISECKQKLEQIKIIRERIQIENDRIRTIARKTRKNYYIRGSIIFSAALVLAVLFAFAFTYLITPALQYNKALTFMESGKYNEAIVMFTNLNDYKDSAEKVAECKTEITEDQYNAATKLMEEGKFAEAEKAFTELGNYKDSTDKLKEASTAIKDAAYNAAAALMKDGKYEESIAAFKALGAYKDTNKKIEACKEAIYNYATELEETDIISSYNSFTYLGDYKDSAEKATALHDKHKSLFAIYNAKVGDYITFGSYEQDNKKKNGKEAIEWLVLKKEEDRIYVISKHSLDCQKYNKSCKNVTWEGSSIRKWLNGTFYKGAFTDAEKKLILTVKANLDNPYYGTVSSAKATEDKILLLGISEAFEYFPSASSRMCAPTDYAKANGAPTSETQLVNGRGAAWYWLLSPGNGQGDAANIRAAGSIRLNGNTNADGYHAYDAEGAVRPTMWITLDFSK